MPARYLYLHGFASSPLSRKAAVFQSALAAHGIHLEVPALDEGDFGHLTISGQLLVVERTLGGEPARLIGSSMGGYLAALYASAHPEVDRLILMAPAFGFASRWKSEHTGEGDFQVFHYGDQAMRGIHYDLIEDALRHPAAPDITQPCRIFHGISDEVVPIDSSRRYAAARPNVFLTEVDSGHELLNVLEDIAARAVPWLISRP